MIFLSYRREDAYGWAALLFRDLAERFGKDVLFMDIKGGIPRGADFEQTLNAALSRCDILLAVVGPRWLELKRNERRRIDADDDWVRAEIHTALKRGIVVVPVLVENASILLARDLPQDLQELATRQVSQLKPEHWDHELECLVTDLSRQAPALAALARKQAVEGATKGFRLLEKLITEGSNAALVIQSRAAISTVHAQIERIEAYKSIHDALHSIEHDCLRQLQASRSMRVVSYQMQLTRAARRVRSSIGASGMSPALRADLEDNLRSAESAFQLLIDQPNDDSRAQALSALSELISGVPAQLDIAIAEASANMDLDQLVKHMQTIANVVEPAGPIDLTTTQPSARTPLRRGVTALQTLRDELQLRVQEHSQLQRLDSELRMIDAAAIPAGSLAQRWARAKSLRRRLVAPFTRELSAAIGALDSLAANVDRALVSGTDASEHLTEYFRAVAGVFREVDGALRELCIELAAVGAPLKTILDLLELAA